MIVLVGGTTVLDFHMGRSLRFLQADAQKWGGKSVLKIFSSGSWTEQQGSDRMYQLVVKLLDANYATLHYFFHKRFPVRPRTGSFSFRVSL